MCKDLHMGCSQKVQTLSPLQATGIRGLYAALYVALHCSLRLAHTMSFPPVHWLSMVFGTPKMTFVRSSLVILKWPSINRITIFAHSWLLLYSDTLGSFLHGFLKEWFSVGITFNLKGSSISTVVELPCCSFKSFHTRLTDGKCSNFILHDCGFGLNEPLQT